ncbi:hypothetical protein Poli38472_013921 [Pythium oligandrum]|uniref:MYND-type domain-containing protein n=1 Tax=Pythium oligandrum TaxID=41045 RepID=A0A8K1C2D5_PYTOL|nr:hypothetical protein Poli38472_013921 [Pythium oligandrum]|eukprot:TMW55159.1 hypothetical protein Poli38472_013921 [Pythium oligandrum]
MCEDASGAAENRLLEHFKLHGGEVWTIGTGCQNCRTKLEDTSALKKCSVCHSALFCDRDCLKNGWGLHKAECTVIATFRKLSTTESDVKIAALLQELGLSTEVKNVSEPKVIGVAKSLQMDENKLPGWFFSIDYELESKERQKALYQTVLSLYALLRDDGSWTRDKESFPRSSYTNVEAIPHAHPTQNEHIQELIQSNGHLLLFSAWLQHPEPPATQSMPLEDRSFYGVVDSLLQISAIRDGIDAFMDSRQ